MLSFVLPFARASSSRPASSFEARTVSERDEDRVTPQDERAVRHRHQAAAAAAPRPPDSPETAPIHQTITPELAQSGAPQGRQVRRPTPAEFNTAMVHFYRGEVTRANTWRNRLDTTTNWAVLTTGATLSFAFSSPTNPHFVILINTVLVGFFLFMEARRYRYYEIWSSRVRMLETGYFTHMLLPDAPTDESWMQMLVDDLKTPHFTISEWEALGRRLRRNYLWIFVLLAACWNLKVYIHPVPAYDFNAFIDRATIGVVPGEIVFMTGIFFNAGLFIFALATMRLQEAVGEVLTEKDFHPFQRVSDWTRNAAERRRTATVRRARAARSRARRTAGSSTGSNTGEWKRADIHRSQPPEDIHRTQYPHRDKVIK
ncbi:MAG TPA: DUF2270 domain-containing protein [Pyrinomonadaceae bacterium]|nr:DUF2270 domain-containing protein [Pyrinomonadaceae bacterium]